MSIKYKTTFKTCPQCGGRLKQGVPRFGPETVTCGHCHAEIKTGLKPWASLNTEQKLWKGFWEMIAPSYIGTYWSIAGIAFLVINAVLVLLPLIGLLELGTSGDFGVESVGLTVGMIIVGGLYAWAFPYKHLSREVAVSDSKDPKPPMWRVGQSREWLKIMWYITLAFVVIMVLVLIALAVSFAINA